MKYFITRAGLKQDVKHLSGKTLTMELVKGKKTGNSYIFLSCVDL